MEDRARNSDAQVYVANLEYTLKELQRKVREHEDKLNELRSEQQQVPQSPAGQIRVITSAFEDVTNSEPFLPFPGSVLPALLALRKTHQAIMESKAFLASQNEVTEKERRRLEAERVTLKDHKLLKEAIATRIQSLQSDLDSSAELRPEDATRKRIEEMEKKKKHYNKETSKLMKALNQFINNHLAAMLAAEELGGPVVGDLMDIDSEDLAAGFSSQGKPKKPKDDAKHDKRQRRIDEIWGSVSAAAEQGNQGRQTDETTAAAAEMRQLTEELLNRLVEARGTNSESYVQLPRETAAARFLIRSKVAEFHPKDATRIRLVDFGRELEA
ncbi:hypothetical protein PT974_09155 [Cladobotryum mycophilum]|uniref:Centromere protein H C-terminal domain-containing protein n=1 Tax=Cladobotryum mycophilum TaxID=491253 RepID=A0ABR0SFH2_9HYPO